MTKDIIKQAYDTMAQLLDERVARCAELEQQLAQAQEKIERLQAIGQELHRKETEAAQQLHETRQKLAKEQDAHQRAFNENVRFLKRETLLRTENATTRALLERVRDLHIDALSPATAEDIRAFLASQEPTP